MPEGGDVEEIHTRVIGESREDRRELDRKMAKWRKLMRDEEDRNRELVLANKSEEAA